MWADLSRRSCIEAHQARAIATLKTGTSDLCNISQYLKSGYGALSPAVSSRTEFVLNGPWFEASSSTNRLLLVMNLLSEPN